ncbi:hypothetical protein ACFO4P_08730 [Epilithonimonas pallida]|uniref:Uncharacterized protein n=2 Tax=Bacteria TaxID=2 RepID=A0ABY1R2S6_9FLAO|nr:hypothetical protein [Epilithonimonas pallida]SMP93677.1 hypothetical protein SAMN05421679_10541 [Epilithonimonas pallida]
MRKTYVLWFAILAILMIGCRNDNFNANETHNNQQALKFRLVSRDEIPGIMSSLQAKTNNFKVPLGSSYSAQGKVETAFGDVVTSYIIESITENGEVYYTFPILSSSVTDTTAETYNLEVKADNAEMTTGKVVVYEPTAEWLANGNNDYLSYSGKVYTYSLEGVLENTVSYLNGKGNCNPEPCPDCPTQPQGPGGGGGTGGGGGGNPGGGNGPTGTGGPVSYPNTGGGGSGSSGCGGWVFSHYIRDNWGNPIGAIYVNGCGQTMLVQYRLPGDNETTETVTFTANRMSASTCGQNDGGVVITTQNDPCTKTKSQLGTASVKEVIQNLKTHISSGAGGEKGYGIKKNGTVSPTTENSDHSVNFGDPSLLNAGYHNHTGTKVDIFSSTDIATLIEIARYNGSSNPTNAFMGLIAPNGIHYIIRFNGLQTDLPPFNSFSDVQKEIWNIEQVVLMSVLLKKNEFSQTINGKKVLNSKGLEQILFDTLIKMGLQDKIVLQQIDDNTKISMVIQNPDKSTTPISCP